MIEYPSIETVYTRSKETNLLNFGEIRNPTNLLISKWTVSEKVDGTNIRVIVGREGVNIRGRSDNAQVHPQLIEAILKLFDNEAVEKLKAEVPEGKFWTFYGEGYGAGIQKAGIGYSQTKRFRGFDIIGPGGKWLPDHIARDYFALLKIPVVPFITVLPGDKLPVTKADLTALLPASIVAFEDSGRSFAPAEGIVAKPFNAVLYDQYGDRVVWKLTFREFKNDRA